jgi:hypothetical protein
MTEHGAEIHELKLIAAVSESSGDGQKQYCIPNLVAGANPD